jgi:predicted N-acetyltransferase YhbS
MSAVIRTCQRGELDPLISLLDEEFIFGKRRNISLRQRFPAVYCGSNLHNILLCMEGGEIVSALAMRTFDWRDGDEIFSGAMIGAVYTHPARRGEGWASRLLKEAENRLRGTSADFAVLWTGQQSFYARLGWVVADCSVLGGFEPHGSIAALPGDAVRLPVPANEQRVEKIRQSLLSATTLRHPGDYRQIPVPAERIELLWCENQGQAAYALFGSSGTTGYLYELIGEADCFPALWAEMCRDRRRVIINDRAGSPSCNWLAAHAGINWEDKNLAMWLPLSERANMPRMRQWHIPYFDRI